MADSKPAALSSAAASEFLSRSTERVKPHTKLIALLALGHFVSETVAA